MASYQEPVPKNATPYKIADMSKTFSFGGIRPKLILLLLLVLVPILLVETFFYYKTFETRKSEELLANLEVARAVAKNFDTFVQYIIHTEFIVGRALTKSPISDLERNAILDDFLADNPTSRSVYWINPKGVIVAANIRIRDYVGVSIADRSYIREIIEGRKNWFVSELYIEKATAKPGFAISRGIRNEHGILLGIVVTAIEPERLDTVLGVERTKDAGVSLIDHKGMHVYRYPFTAYTMEQRNWLKHYPIVENSLKGQEVITSVISEASRKERLVAFTPVSSIGWVASASRAEDEAIGPIRSTIGFHAGMTLLVVLLSFITALFLSRSTLNAITKLRNQALALGRGELETIATTHGPDEIKDLARALDQMAKDVMLRQKQMEDANKEMESFSYTVSHDLKAPLRAIGGFSRMILKKEETRFDEETRRRFQVVTENCQTMGRMIDDLLTFSRMSRQELTKTNLDMPALVHDVYQELVAIHPDRAMTLKVEPMPASLGDPSLVRQVYANLLGNAVKFTEPRESALIEAGSIVKDNETIYYIKDNGIGFDMQFYEKLFGVFQRLHSNEEYEGMGIGLATVQRIIKRHGGRVWAEGEVGKGATFYFTLPTSQE